MGTSIVVTSGKGGVGKSTTAANLSLALVQADKRVCVVDLDVGLRNLDAILGLRDRVIYDVIDVIENRIDVFQALIPHPDYDDRFYLLAASQSATQHNLNIERVQEIVNDLKTNFDFVILDCPAGIGAGFQAAVAAADSALIVTTPEIAAVSDADRVVGILEEMHLKYGMHLVINRIRMKMLKNGKSMDIQNIVDRLSVPLIGVIIDDDEVIATSNQGKSVVTSQAQNLAAIGYANLARRILGENLPLNEINDNSTVDKKPGFWYRMFHH